MMETQDQDDSLYEHYAFTADNGQGIIIPRKRLPKAHC